MNSEFCCVVFMILMDVMLLPGISTAHEYQNYSRNDTAMLFATGRPVTKSRVDSEKGGNSDCLFNFEGACSLSVRVKTSDSVTCSTLDINNTRVSLCCNTGKWCTVPGSIINLGMSGINIITTDCSNISMDIIVKSVTCSGSSMECEDGKRNCTGILQTTMSYSMDSNHSTSSETDKNVTEASTESRGNNFNPLTITDWTTFAIIVTTISSNLTAKQTNNESILGNILGTINTKATTGSPDVTNSESPLKSMYTFLAVLGAILLAVFILVCICFCRTKSPKISQSLSANDLWPDRDVFQRHHSTDFSPYVPYCVNPAYEDYFDERRKIHVRNPNRYDPNTCRAHPPTPTLPTHCCSGKSDWSPPSTESPATIGSPSRDIYSLSYRKTDFYIDNISGNESDV
ncbi:hypothetical protein ACJMK2_042261 [Sinanodonta woodiana]|uniref:Uncharacterized protein n=1 Tax=Sinanodonta woodiana TaxID=1069815 RepID=A0ABD3WA26_SINWO